MIKTILIDDNYPVLQSIEKHLKKIVGLKVLQTFTEVSAALDFLKDYGKVDLILCDIEMPEMDGLEAAPLLRPYCQRFIFLTGHKQYAFDAFGVDAHGYLLKPVGKQEVLKEMAVIWKERESRAADVLANDHFVVNDAGEKEQKFIAIKDIICVKAHGHYVNIFCNEHKEAILHRDKLDNIELSLRRFGGFLRTHRSYIIATGAIVKIKKMSIIHLKGGLKANISRSYSGQVKKWLNNL